MVSSTSAASTGPVPNESPSRWRGMPRPLPSLAPAPLSSCSDRVSRARRRASLLFPKALGPHLNEELVPPAVERLEALGAVDVVDKDAAVGAAVEGDAEGLEAFLAGRVPELWFVRA